MSYVVETLGKHWQMTQPWLQDSQRHAPEAQTLKLDVAKATQGLRWRSQLSIDEGLNWVASWFRAFHAGEDARSLCEQQISRYVNGTAPRR